MSDYNRKVVLSVRGKERREVTLNDVQIPDLWHVAERLRRDDPDGAAAVLECWRICHDLKANLANDIEAPEKQPRDRAWGLYPAGWPACPACARPALDGHITCGNAVCNEGGRR